MFKSYAGKKISQIMEKTPVDFVSVTYNLFFLNLPLVMSDGDPSWPSAACLRLPGVYCLWLTP